MSRRKKDLAAMAAFAASMYGLNEARKVDKSLGPKVDLRADGSPDPYPDKKRVSSKELKGSGESVRDELDRDKYAYADKEGMELTKSMPDRLARARAAAIKEEPSLKGVAVDSSNTPIRSGSVFLGTGKKAGGVIKSSASKRADGIAQRGKTKGRMC